METPTYFLSIQMQATVLSKQEVPHTYHFKASQAKMLHHHTAHGGVAHSHAKPITSAVWTYVVPCTFGKEPPMQVRWEHHHVMIISITGIPLQVSQPQRCSCSCRNNSKHFYENTPITPVISNKTLYARKLTAFYAGPCIFRFRIWHSLHLLLWRC